MSQPYITRPKKTQYRKTRKPPTPPKKCEICETMTGNRVTLEDGHIVRTAKEFPSRRQAKKALAKIIITLPKKRSPNEVDKYYVRNV